jgi:hypothetical protein
MKKRAYRVSFSKDLLSSDGHPFRCLQDTIQVVAKSTEEATQAAQKQFEDRRRLGKWQLHADYVEAVEVREAGCESARNRDPHPY